MGERHPLFHLGAHGQDGNASLIHGHPAQARRVSLGAAWHW